MRFDSASHLEGWMNAPERKEMLSESKAFIEHEQLTRLATAFPGWFPTDPKTGKGPPNWKAGMLVLLGLFPIVMLEARFLSPRLASLNFSLGMFIGNVLSVAATTYLTMPLFIKTLKWWLLPEPDAPKSVHWKGTLLVCALYALSVAIFWKFM
jgi:antibiotic biosynthesis monooxygenase (ABM) superfamily enzyme